MITAGILFVIAVFWFFANQSFQVTGSQTDRRKRASYSWAFIGASIGSYFGVAGLGNAISGAVPGALLAYLIASHLMLRRNSNNASDELSKVNGSTSFSAIAQSAGAATGRAFNSIVEICRTILGLAILAFIGFWLYGIFTSKTPATSHTENVAPTIQSTAIESNSKGPRQQRSTYDVEVTKLEQRFPKIDPDSPKFDSVFTNQLASRILLYKSQGATPEDALRRASIELLEAKPIVKNALPKHVLPTPKPDDYKNCFYKGIMTDEDYRACGLNAPGAR